MLYDLEPDRSVTGGAFYCDQEFESEFVDVLTNQSYQFLYNKVHNTMYAHYMYVLSCKYFILN
jgi:DNA-directed RNA polymerase III subunit RPC6